MIIIILHQIKKEIVIYQIFHLIDVKKKSPINQDSIEQVHLKNFNKSFFLPEVINKYLEGEEENQENMKIIISILQYKFRKIMIILYRKMISVLIII